MTEIPLKKKLTKDERLTLALVKHVENIPDFKPRCRARTLTPDELEQLQQPGSTVMSVLGERFCPASQPSDYLSGTNKTINPTKGRAQHSKRRANMVGKI